MAGPTRRPFKATQKGARERRRQHVSTNEANANDMSTTVSCGHVAVAIAFAMTMAMTIARGPQPWASSGLQSEVSR